MGSWKLDLSDGSWWWSEELFRIYGRDTEAAPLTGEELLERILPATASEPPPHCATSSKAPSSRKVWICGYRRFATTACSGTWNE